MEPGVQSNNEVVTYPALGGGTTSAERSDIDRQYRYDETRTVTNLPATGRIDGNRSSFAVRVFLNRVYYEDVLRESGELDGTTWEDYKTDMMRAQVTVPIPIETIDLIRNATGVQNVVIEGYELPIFIPSETIVRPINQMLMAAVLLLLIALLAFGLIRRTQPDEITEIEPELSVEELLVSSSGEEDEPLAEIDYFSDSELKKQIDKFVEEKPEAAAQLLRNWLTEDWD
jgi:flagellar M-ring protein FliF